MFYRVLAGFAKTEEAVNRGWRINSISRRISNMSDRMFNECR